MAFACAGTVLKVEGSDRFESGRRSAGASAGFFFFFKTSTQIFCFLFFRGRRHHPLHAFVFQRILIAYFLPSRGESTPFKRCQVSLL